jgi:hypothetical protein
VKLLLVCLLVFLKLTLLEAARVGGRGMGVRAALMGASLGLTFTSISLGLTLTESTPLGECC